MSSTQIIQKKLKALLKAECSKDEMLKQLLQIGCEYYGLMLGLISVINDNDYRVISAYPDGLIKMGETLKLRNTICDVTRQNLKVTSFSKANGTEWMNHPAYDTLSIESYIGANYYIDGKKTGTINFSSPTPLGREFTEADIEVINICSKTLSSILE